MPKHPTQAHQLQTELKPRPRIQEFSALGMAFRSNVGVSVGGVGRVEGVCQRVWGKGCGVEVVQGHGGGGVEG